MNLCRHPRSNRGFSLIELVIVVVIIGIIAAIAVPRLSRGSAGAADSALAGDLAVLRNAIDLYATEHGGDYPDADKIEDQLMMFTNDAGETNATRTTTHIYGPYIRKVPPLPVGSNKGDSKIAAADGDGVGWIYVESSGSINANLPATELDARDTPYKDY